MFKKLLIIGCGLIGSSLLRASINKKISRQILVFEKSKRYKKQIKSINSKIIILDRLDKNISDVEVLKEVLKEGNLDVESIMEIVLSQDCKDKLIKNTDDAVNKGCFGVPTFFYDNQIFFGKDHLHQLEQYINSNK